ncbi:DNA-binding transcriptional regulator, GntR family [Chelatococcus sambhunathii]|uniref:DNA-binding transcriptional regulator, GntR family n=1 Tax=Chelatococcus sambhunathii TaxID=363953 RepID=A0ABP2A0Y1_9HYPH|nr:GntR family transcriptional regulator [Chelatococcus sambhunathii]CUA86394.1 DNA-binding transcriptional regulator, GntR family [Chelatococcus sambhunathii]
MIYQHRLKGGEIIVEARIADMLGISRTPLREALQRLEGEGLVAKASNRSFVVRQVDLIEYLQSLKVLEFLEPEAATLAIGRVHQSALCGVRAEIESAKAERKVPPETVLQIEEAVQSLYTDHCGNSALRQTIRALRIATRLFGEMRWSGRREKSFGDHLAIVDALEAEDVKRARRAVQQHLKALHRHGLSLMS